MFEKIRKRWRCWQRGYHSVNVSRYCCLNGYCSDCGKYIG